MRLTLARDPADTMHHMTIRPAITRVSAAQRESPAPVVSSPSPYPSSSHPGHSRSGPWVGRERERGGEWGGGCLFLMRRIGSERQRERERAGRAIVRVGSSMVRMRTHIRRLPRQPTQRYSVLWHGSWKKWPIGELETRRHPHNERPQEVNTYYLLSSFRSRMKP